MKENYIRVLIGAAITISGIALAAKAAYKGLQEISGIGLLVAIMGCCIALWETTTKID